jgi:hypothetical protein
MTPRHRAEAFRRFLNGIDASRRTPTCMSCSTSSTTKPRRSSAGLSATRTSRSTHADLLLADLVERWFAELTTKWIKRNAHRSVRNLVGSIRTWISNWNDDPKPYVWHKSADEVRDSLSAYRQRINDSGH